MREARRGARHRVRRVRRVRGLQSTIHTLAPSCALLRPVAPSVPPRSGSQLPPLWMPAGLRADGESQGQERPSVVDCNCRAYAPVNLNPVHPRIDSVHPRAGNGEPGATLTTTLSPLSSLSIADPPPSSLTAPSPIPRSPLPPLPYTPSAGAIPAPLQIRRC